MLHWRRQQLTALAATAAAALRPPAQLPPASPAPPHHHPPNGFHPTSSSTGAPSPARPPSSKPGGASLSSHPLLLSSEHVRAHGSHDGVGVGGVHGGPSPSSSSRLPNGVAQLHGLGGHDGAAGGAGALDPHEMWAAGSSSAGSQQGDGASPIVALGGGGGGGALALHNGLGGPRGSSGGGGGGGVGSAPPLDAEAEASARELVQRALQGPLLPAQQAVVQSALARDASLACRLGVGAAQLPLLVEHTPALAVEVIVALAPTPLLPSLLETLARSDMSLHSMEVVNRLTGCMELPTEFLHLYIANCIRSCEEATQDKYVQSRLVRLLCVFLQSLIRSRVINIADCRHEIQAFCVNFSRVREAAKLFRVLKQAETTGRLGGLGGDGLGSPGGAGEGGGGGGSSASGAAGEGMDG